MILSSIVFDKFDPVITPVQQTPYERGDNSILIICAVSAVLGIIGGIICFKKGDKIGGMAGLVFSPFMIIVMLVPTYFLGFGTTTSESKYAITETQNWASGNYMIALNDAQTENLIKYRMSKLGDRYTPTLVKYYDKNIFITMVKVDKEWVLFMNDEELVKTTQ